MSGFDSSPKSVERLLKEMAAVPSVSGSQDEIRMAHWLADKLKELTYFKEHPQDLKMLPLDDGSGRFNVAAIMKAKSETKRTIILTGHFDVVEPSESTLADLMFDVDRYSKRVGELFLSESSRRDYNSKNYLYGRGVFDMKAGHAAILAILGDIDQGKFLMDVNIVYLAVCDEENLSAGMRAAVPWLQQLNTSYDLLVIINTEPSWNGAAVTLYYGTIGKLMPFYYCIGKQAHVSNCYDGISSPLLASHLNILVEGNADSIEEYNGEFFPAVTALKMKDLRDHYEVTVPQRSVVFYNQFCVQRQAGEIMDNMLTNAEQALRLSRDQLEKNRSDFISRGGKLADSDLAWNEQTLTFNRLYALAVARCGEAQVGKAVDQSCEQSQSRGLDVQDQAIALVGRLVDLADLTGPAIVVGFLPPYYPPRVNRRQSEREKQIVRLTENEITAMLSEQGMEVCCREVFTGIMDLSFTGFQGSQNDLDSIAANMAGWPTLYSLAGEQLRAIDIPFFNFGTIGDGAHQKDERIDKKYTFERYPENLKRVIKLFSEKIV